VFDTGSTNSWVNSVLTKLPERQKAQIQAGISLTQINTRASDLSHSSLFNPFESDTFKPTENTCSIQFGSGPLEGVFGKETVSIGDVLKVDD